jgi:glycine dehydrogenase subunit 2
MSEIKSGMLRKEPLIFEKSQPGREGFSLPPAEVPRLDKLPDSYLRKEQPTLPALSEVEVIRHYTRLSHWNHCIELGTYPLGSCTMKYNPKINEKIAEIRGLTSLHPAQSQDDIQGALELMYILEKELCTLSGFSRVTLQPSAGANGEFTGLSIIQKAINEKGEAQNRKKVLIPDSAHGTNPASVVLNGFKPVEIKSGPDGYLELESIKPHLDSQLAAIMVTNPNTLGIYERNLREISKAVHKAGGYVYMDGANFNAIMGVVKPADIGVDTMHFNLHKTFSTPHGGGGPGAGPVGVVKALEPYLPVPVIEKNEQGNYFLDIYRPLSIGKVHPFFGNYAVLVRALVYILENGSRGLAEVTKRAVLNARYLRARLSKILDIPYKTNTLHEAVFSDRKLKKETGVTTMDVAKRLLDFGVHPPTVYFPLIVSGAFMVEPTETESLQDLDAFVDIVSQIISEAKSDPDKVKTAPHNTGVGRLDETYAARSKILRWKNKK